MIFKKSTRKNKKYMVFHNRKWIHFGDLRYEHYKDNTPLKLYSYLNHNDKIRKMSYLRRARGIRDKSGKLLYKDKNSPNYYAIKYLW